MARGGDSRRGTQGSGRSKVEEGYAGVGQARDGSGRVRKLVNFDKKSAKIYLSFSSKIPKFSRAPPARGLFISLPDYNNQTNQTNNTISTNVNDYTRKNDEFCAQQVKIQMR